MRIVHRYVRCVKATAPNAAMSAADAVHAKTVPKSASDASRRVRTVRISVRNVHSAMDAWISVRSASYTAPNVRKYAPNAAPAKNAVNYALPADSAKTVHISVPTAVKYAPAVRNSVMTVRSVKTALSSAPTAAKSAKTAQKSANTAVITAWIVQLTLAITAADAVRLVLTAAIPSARDVSFAPIVQTNIVKIVNCAENALSMKDCTVLIAMNVLGMFPSVPTDAVIVKNAADAAVPYPSLQTAESVQWQMCKFTAHTFCPNVDSDLPANVFSPGGR